MVVAASMVLELVAVVVARRTAEEPVWSGKEELKVVVGHWKRWSWYCMEPLVKALVVGLPLSYSLNYS
jgi:hypothetical protein